MQDNSRIIGEREVEIRAKLPTLDPKGATTGENLSVALGFHLLAEAGMKYEEIKVINDNKKTLETVNLQESFKEAVREHGWSKHNLWKDKKRLVDVSGDWSSETKGLNGVECFWINKKIRHCHNLARIPNKDGE